jgi:hypothetical protein
MTGTVFVKTSTTSPVRRFHTDESCRFLERASNYKRVERDTLFDDLEGCAYCAGEITHTTGPKPHVGDTCRACGADLDPDGSCGFCQRFEEVMG